MSFQRWETMEDGRLLLKGSQSWLGTFLMCPEEARLEGLGLAVSPTTDASALGTAFHAGAEHFLRNGGAEEGAKAVVAAYEEIEELGDRYHAAPGVAQEGWTGIKYVQVAKRETAIAQALKCYDAWFKNVMPALPGPLDDRAIERRFKDVVLYEDDRMVITIAGTMDYVDEFECIWDWKTAGREYEAYEYKRYKIQPTVYTFALAHELGLHDHPEVVDWEFSYGISIKSGRKTNQMLHVTRNNGHWSWLQEQFVAIGNLILADLPTWPLNDQGWWCSPKWCSAWDQCKGKHLGESPW